MGAEFIGYAASSLSLVLIESSCAMKILGLVGFILSTFYIYWTCWPWTLTSVAIALASIALYHHYENKRFFVELKRNWWYVAYLLGLAIISLLGDSTYIYNNFLPIQPLNIFRMPIDLVVITLFALCIALWAYKTNKQFVTAK